MGTKPHGCMTAWSQGRTTALPHGPHDRMVACPQGRMATQGRMVAGTHGAHFTAQPRGPHVAAGPHGSMAARQSVRIAAMSSA